MPYQTFPNRLLPFCFGLLLLLSSNSFAQQVTGVWKGKIDRKKVEVKIIQKGDSLTGTSYYYESTNNYRRYSIKGHFDAYTNSVVWWDDQLIEERSGNLLSSPGKTPQLAVADFNCPGGGQLFLEGKSGPKAEPNQSKGPVDLTKINTPIFKDEWDYIIDNYTMGTNNPYEIDSVARLAWAPKKVAPTPVKEEPPVVKRGKPGMVSIPPMQQPETAPVAEPIKPLTIEEKFVVRKKVLVTELPVAGDSIELRFYDNAEVDGDSISLFLNEKLIFQHIKLLAKPYTIKLPVSSLGDENELIMVAENLGSIPPNTAYMIAMIDGVRYEANLSSTESTSALIRLKKFKKVPGNTQ